MKFVTISPDPDPIAQELKTEQRPSFRIVLRFSPQDLVNLLATRSCKKWLVSQPYS